MILQPKIFDSSKVIAAQSTRLGGVSAQPFDSMNLGLSVNDDEQNVWTNRELFFEKLGIDLKQVSRCHQVHGNEVLVVNEPVTNEKYDAQITNKPNTKKNRKASIQNRVQYVQIDEYGGGCQDHQPDDHRFHRANLCETLRDCAALVQGIGRLNEAVVLLRRSITMAESMRRDAIIGFARR